MKEFDHEIAKQYVLCTYVFHISSIISWKLFAATNIIFHCLYNWLL